MTRRPPFAALFAVFLITGLRAPASARIGLSTQFVDVTVEELEPGRTYSLRELRGSPYAVKNRGDGVVEVSLEAMVPTVLVSPYEALPDPGWIELTPSLLRIEPGMLGLSDVLLKIPDDPKLRGRHFQATILARTLKTGIVGTGVKSRLRFSIGPGPDTVGFDLTPAELTLSKARTETVYDGAAAERRSFRLTNKTNVELRLALTAIPWEGAVALPAGGWETPAELAWVRFEPPLATVGAFASAEVKMVLEGAPAALAGRKAAFLIQPRLSDGRAVGRPLRGFVNFRRPAKKKWWVPW